MPVSPNPPQLQPPRTATDPLYDTHGLVDVGRRESGAIGTCLHGGTQATGFSFLVQFHTHPWRGWVGGVKCSSCGGDGLQPADLMAQELEEPLVQLLLTHPLERAVVCLCVEMPTSPLILPPVWTIQKTSAAQALSSSGRAGRADCDICRRMLSNWRIVLALTALKNNPRHPHGLPLLWFSALCWLQRKSHTAPLCPPWQILPLCHLCNNNSVTAGRVQIRVRGPELA